MRAKKVDAHHVKQMAKSNGLSYLAQKGMFSIASGMGVAAMMAVARLCASFSDRRRHRVGLRLNASLRLARTIRLLYMTKILFLLATFIWLCLFLGQRLGEVTRVALPF